MYLMNLMTKKNNKKGFTLAELLIVVAIIAVLVAIAIPVFTDQLYKAQHATDVANMRSALAEAVTTEMLEANPDNQITVKKDAKHSNVTADNSNHKITVTHSTKSAYTTDIPFDTDLTVTIGS